MTDDTRNDTTNDAAVSPPPSRHVSVWIAADADAVYEFAGDPRQLPRWAAGLSDPALADAAVSFVPSNHLGVLDHLVRLPSGEQVYNPMRVIPSEPGETHCEVIFTIRRRPGTTDEEFEADAAAVTADLSSLRDVIERPD